VKGGKTPIVEFFRTFSPCGSIHWRKMGGEEFFRMFLAWLIMSEVGSTAWVIIVLQWSVWFLGFRAGKQEEAQEIAKR
jgi:hypothetical protein